MSGYRRYAVIALAALSAGLGAAGVNVPTGLLELLTGLFAADSIIRPAPPVGL